MDTSHTPPPLVSHTRTWRVQLAGPEQLGALADLVKLHGTRPAAIREAARELGRCARQWVTGEAPPDKLEVLRPGLVGHDGAAKQHAVKIPANLMDRETLARVELVFTHANGARPTMSELLRLVVVRGAELARSRSAAVA